MPFRSEAEQLREQTRRAEEVLRELLDEKADLERQLAGQNRRRAWVLGFLAVVTIACGLGFAGGVLDARRKASRALESRLHADMLELERERAELRQCATAESVMRTDLEGCVRELGTQTTTRQPAAPCRCAAGDPLCDCAFDRGAAASALGGASSPIRACLQPVRPLSFHVKITFQARGEASAAVIDNESTGTLTLAERTCAEGVLRKVKVPGFGGAPVSVGKTYAFEVP